MTYEFVIRAVADPQTLPRVVGQLGRHWATPGRLEAAVSGGDMLIRFETGDLTDASAAMVLAHLRSSVLVHDAMVHPDVAAHHAAPAGSPS